MKKTFKLFVSAVAAMATLAGCAKNEISNQTPETKTVQVVARHGQTKTTLFDSKYVRWTATDAVRAYGYLDNYVSTSTEVFDGGATATFTFATGDDEIVYMVYPAAAAGEVGSNDWIEVTIPTEQTAVANGFADGANVAIGEYAEGEADFYSIGALVSFDIKNDNITSIKLEFTGAEYAVTGKGTAKIDTDTYGGIGDELTEPGTANYVELKAAQGQTLTNGAKYFAVVYADDYTGMKLTFTRNDGKTATYTNSGQLKLDINSNYTIFNTQIPDSKWQGAAPSGDKFVKLNSVDELEDNMEVVIVAHDVTTGESASDTYYAIPVNPTVSSGKIVGAAVTVVDGEITASDAEGYVWTLEKSGDFYVLSDGSKNLYHKNGGASGTDLTYGESQTLLWNITAAPTDATEGTFKFAGVSQTTVNNRGLLFDKNVDKFGGYALSNISNIQYCGIDVYKKNGTSAKKYSVTCATVDGGTLSATPAKAAAGTTVTLTAEPSTGYEFESWNVTGATVADATSATTTFTMPAANVNVSATFKEITSIPDKTIAEFIAAKGGNCYLTGVVSNIVNTTFGNFDLTDASGTIYIYGCLTSEGVARQFSTLGVDEGDKIKVLASEYEYFQSTTHEAKNVVFVEIVEKATKYNVTVASGIANGTVTVNPAQAAEGQTVTITATPATGYKLKSVSAKKTASGTALTVTDNKFTMPAEAVTVSAEFEVDASGETTVKLNISTWLSENTSVVVSSGSNVGSKIASIALDSNITVSISGTGNTGTFWGTSPSNDWRIYSKSGDEATVSIDASNSKKIKSVMFTFTISNGGGLKYNTTSLVTNKTQAISPSAASVTLSVPYQSGKTGQARITAIEVVYE